MEIPPCPVIVLAVVHPVVVAAAILATRAPMAAAATPQMVSSR